VEKVVKLNEAFQSFTQASKTLETYYEKLNKRVQYLTHELESKNIQLNTAILEVRESKDYLHTVLQSIGEAIIVLDQDERINMINKAAEDMLCSGSDDVKGMIIDDLDFIVVDSNGSTTLTVENKRYDIIFSRSPVCDPEGSVRGYVILIKDITRLKELERQHERNERLIAMGEMAAKIVHEIRSPLCSIELFSNMLSKDLEGSAHSEMANGISTGIKSLNNILTNMLFFAKPQKPSFSDIGLSTAVNDSVRMLAPLIDVRGIKVSKELSGEIIHGDIELLKQVFMNIILNAVQAMPEGGELKIMMGEDNDHIAVQVRDEGVGVNPDMIEKIFDPFFSTKDKGTGLGLAIAHKIMQSHGGFIRAARNEDRGSTFTVYFPKITHENTEEIQEILYEKAGN
jgi:signal transduction histidine kinase